jgi:hypothetical protein
LLPYSLRTDRFFYERRHSAPRRDTMRRTPTALTAIGPGEGQQVPHGES